MSFNDRMVVFQDLTVNSVEHLPPRIHVGVSDLEGPRGTLTYLINESTQR